jgi:hypothetical protein
MHQYPLAFSFFGLTPSYRNTLFAQIHDLVYHGGGGFIHSEVYNMPTWMRLFHIQKISEFNKKQNEEIEKANKKPSSSNKPMGPNVNPSSTYNF